MLCSCNCQILKTQNIIMTFFVTKNIGSGNSVSTFNLLLHIHESKDKHYITSILFQDVAQIPQKNIVVQYPHLKKPSLANGKSMLHFMIVKSNSQRHHVLQRCQLTPFLLVSNLACNDESALTPHFIVFVLCLFQQKIGYCMHALLLLPLKSKTERVRIHIHTYNEFE